MNPLQKKYGKSKIWVNYQLSEVKGKVTKVPYGMDGNKASSTNPETWGDYIEARGRDEKIGIVLTNGLVGIDVDKCIEGGKIVPELQEEIADLILTAGTYTEISPSGKGLHLYFHLSEPYELTANKKAPYEVYNKGRYFTVTGRSYGLEEDVREVTRAELEEILSVIGYPWGKKSAEEKKEESKNAQLLAKLRGPIEDQELLTRMFKAKNGDAIERLWNGGISAYGDDASNADMALCSHLAFWTRKDPGQIERLWLSSPLGQREKTIGRKDYRDLTISNAIALTKEVYETPEERAADVVEENEDLDLLFIETRTGVQFIVNTENIARILRKSPKFKNKVRYDMFKNITEFKDKKEGWRDIKDGDVIEVQTEISVEFPAFVKVGKQMVEDAMNLVASENKIDSAADWVKGIKWDGEKRLGSWLSKTYGVTDDEYHQSVGSNWFKGMVKRIVHPGCKFDYVLVLEGEQGTKKSTSLGVLGGDWYVETTMSTDSKDFFMQFQGKAIVEFSEGETLSRTEVKRMKAIITTAVDKYRPAYGRFSVDFPRRCVFAMTTNQDEYLKDETGNRRWLPVACNGVANVEWLKENREQLFAEAYQRVIIDGETTWEFPEDLMEAAQNERRIHDPNEDIIVDWYFNKIHESDRESGVSARNAYEDLFNPNKNQKVDRYLEMQIANVFKNTLKLSKNRKMINGVQSMRWFKTQQTPGDYERQEPYTATEKLEAVYKDF